MNDSKLKQDRGGDIGEIIKYSTLSYINRMLTCYNCYKKNIYRCHGGEHGYLLDEIIALREYCKKGCVLRVPRLRKLREIETDENINIVSFMFPRKIDKNELDEYDELGNKFNLNDNLIN
jgi:hypothetical protein